MKVRIIEIEGDFDEVMATLDMIQATVPAAPNIKASKAPASASTTETAAKREQIGILQRQALRARFVQSRRDAGVGLLKSYVEFWKISDDQWWSALNTVAAAHGFDISAIGDGTLFQLFLEFLSEHWDDILRILLPLLGL
ncbi:MAG: hypothetical protein U0798_15010 [Gemmataceae bacterium]